MGTTHKVIAKIEQLLSVLKFADVTIKDAELFEEILLIIERQETQIETLQKTLTSLLHD